MGFWKRLFGTKANKIEIPAETPNAPPVLSVAPPPEPSREDRLITSFNNLAQDGGASLRSDLDALIRDEPECNILAIDGILGELFRSATNRGKCPCGSNLEFDCCCKQRWREVQRMSRLQVRELEEKRQAEIAGAELKRKAERQEANARQGVEWLYQVGIGEKGLVAMDILDAGKRTSMRVICDAMAAVYGQMQEQIIMQATVERINQMAQSRMAESKARVQIDKGVRT